MSNHTPAPWHVKPEGELRMTPWIIDSNDNSICALLSDSRKRKANANLIAAAPELLEACEQIEEIISWITFENLTEQQIKTVKDIDNIACNAISKAKGE